MRIGRLTLFHKLFLTFLVLILPLVTLSLIVNVRSERLVREQITSAAQDKLRDYLHALEGDVGTLVTLMQQYVLDDEFNHLAYSSVILSDEQFTFMVKSVQRKLLILKNMSPYVKDAFVNVPALNRKISAVAYNELPVEEAAALKRMVDLYESPFTRYDGRLWLSLPVPNSSPVGQGFTIALELSNEALLASLGGLNVSGDGGALLHDGEWGWIVSSGSLPEERSEMLEFLQNSVTDGEPELYSEGKARYYAFHQTSPRLGLSLAMFLEEKSLIGPLRQYAAWLWSLSIAAVALVLLFSYRLYRMIHAPMKRLVGAFRSLESGNLNQQLRAESDDEFSYLYHQFNRTVNRLRELIDEVYVQRYQVKAAELKQLQSQINPHFLYNSFFNLYRLAKLRENDKVIAFSWHLGDYYKYVTKNADHVELEQEVAFCRSYAAIQSIRFGDHILIRFGEVPESLRHLHVPKLFLQPLIENAYHHGLEDRADQGVIDIAFCHSDSGNAVIVVEDNGDALDEEAMQRIRSLLEDPERPAESEGLRNVLQRIRFHYGEQAMLVADRSPLGGLRITMTIPIKEDSV